MNRKRKNSYSFIDLGSRRKLITRNVKGNERKQRRERGNECKQRDI